MINYTAWDTYLGRCYYQLNQSVIVNGTFEQNCYTEIREANKINISTVSYFVYWPYPPIIIMGVIYWTLFLVLRRFNKRYIEVKAFEKEHPDEFKKQEYSW
jgi:hypothetical protein